MFSKFFKRKKEESEEQLDGVLPLNGADWSFLGTDIHSHFIPGIDDGAQTVEDSLTLIRSMIDMGFKNIVTSPHVFIDYYPNTTTSIQNGLQVLQDALKENNIDIKVKAAAEYYVDEYFSDLIDKEPLLTVHDNKVLIEFSMLFEPVMMNDVIFKMQGAGYRPILAHPERYLFFHKDLDKYRELKDRGCLLQLNLLSTTGYYGKGVKEATDKLLAQGMYDYCGTDMHHERHAVAMRGLLHSKLYSALANYPFLNSKITF